MAWYEKLMFWRDDEPAVDGDYGIDGCFTLPDATLDDLADTPAGGPEDQLRPEDF